MSWWLPMTACCRASTFGHLNCRTGGHMNTREEVRALFDLMENTIGRERTAKLHAHFSHIEYNDKGEVRHLTFADTVYGPDFTPVAEETRRTRLRTDVYLRIRRNAGGGRFSHEAVLHGQIRNSQCVITD